MDSPKSSTRSSHSPTHTFVETSPTSNQPDSKPVDPNIPHNEKSDSPDLERADHFNKESEAEAEAEYDANDEDSRIGTLKGNDPYEIDWDGPTDPANPLDWSPRYRWFLTAISGLLVLNASFASSAPSGIAPAMMKYFGFSQEVAALTISVFVAGYCLGPIVWGPLSERRGRRFTFIVAYIPYTAFQIGCALSKNTASIIIFRLLGGTFAAAPLSVAGALMADLHRPKQRGIAMSVFALMPFAGPALGPIVSGFIYVSGTDWRWLYWVLTMFAGFCVIIILFVLPETYGPVILERKALAKRKETGDERWHARGSKTKVRRSAMGHAYELVASPFVMLFQEPMLMAVSIYMAFIYGCLYLLFEALPLIFQRNHGWNAGVEGLAFIPMFLGGIFANLLNIFVFNTRYERLTDRIAPKRPKPEVRLEMCLVGGPLLVVSFFWLGWTGNYPSVSYWAPLFAIGVLGACLIMIFLPLINYIVDTYLMKSATALSANAILRSAFGAGFPLFASQMFEKLGIAWASSLLGFIALLLVPIPWLFWRYGEKLRGMSKHAAVREE